MPHRNTLRYVLVALAIGLVAAACSSSGSSETTVPANTETGFSFGEPADASEATRVIDITAADDFRFNPDAIMVSAGEVVTFRITNEGSIAHDFVIGDEAAQDEHEVQMQNSADPTSEEHEDPNTLLLPPGETREMTWRMTSTGEILMGCHQPGHYAAGMKGTIDITS